ncbi:hypothetical protein LZ906_017540 (plasmid) [Paraclostridium ghonii]|uniref:hypothetical protein n=1 Tax=Paraclostridium ghonii TaxID=29358 RepID=UPI00202CB3E7|nr:hypothetical protein [Paeniclostridium ghonii]MCM0166538.1 hypothetical protein [Paeniclostridium ghonii]
MKVKREISDFEKADIRDTYNYLNYCALLACILNENLTGDQSISKILGAKKNDNRAGRKGKKI